MLDAFETASGASAKLRLLTGSTPADCATAQSGTLLCEIALPADYMANAASGSKAKSGTWSGTGSAAGNVGYFRIVDNAGTTCHAQGTVTATGGGGDMTMDNINVANGQSIVVNTYQYTAGNA